MNHRIVNLDEFVKKIILGSGAVDFIHNKPGKGYRTGESRGNRIQNMQGPVVPFNNEIHFQLPGALIE